MQVNLLKKVSIKYYLDALLQLFFPSICYACNDHQIDHEEMLCLRCLQQLPYTSFESILDNPTEKLFWGRIQIMFACSIFYFEKENIIQQFIHQIKYKNEKQLGIFMGRLMGMKLISIPELQQIDYMIPMPLHPKKEKKRGYNQATLLCKGIKETCELDYDEKLITRIKQTQTQTKKSRIERWQNVEEVFCVPSPEKIINKNILLIDDVITTGASAESCGRILLEYGARSISICGLAQTMN